jgi:hypothetical protein
MSADAKLAEFISSLIGDLLQSLQTSFLEQLDDQRAASEALSRPLEAIARSVPGEDVEAELRANPSLHASADEARLAVARRERSFGEAVLAQGLPKIFIESGELKARVAFSASAPEAPEAPAAPSGAKVGRAEAAVAKPPEGLRTVEILRASLSRRAAEAEPRPQLRHLRVDVRAPPDRAPAASDAAVEISLKFKVVY